MLDKAIEKIKKEMESNKNNMYIQAVGSFLLQYLGTNPGAAEKILNTEKTIAKSLDEMRKVAAKKKVGNCAVLTDQEGFEVVLKYFGINDKVDKVDTTNIIPEVKPAAKKSFNVKLDDLL